MIEPSLSSTEPLRLQSLRQTKQLDTPLEERFERITRLAQRLLRTPIAAISLVDADRQWFKSIQGLGISETSRAVSFCGHNILQDEVMVVSDARLDPRFCDNPLVTGRPHIVFYAACPIRSSDGHNIASLCVIDHQSRRMSHEERQLLRDLAAIAESEFALRMHSSVQAELMDQVESTKRQAQVDPLTRIWNRTSIFELLHAEVERAKRSGGGIGVIMADIDHFKQVNDTYGHAAGDEVLRESAKRMLGAIREFDALGRYGGEEFMIVLGSCEHLDRAVEVAERVRTRVCEGPFVTEQGVIPVTLSLGVAFSASPSVCGEQVLVRAADEALYRAKRGGRNCVQVAPLSPTAGSVVRAA
jgi:diguanylate cyclase (GGDEF)-like protein